MALITTMKSITGERLQSFAADSIRFLSQRPKQTLFAVITAAVINAVIRHLSARKRRRKRWAKAGKDIVILHGFTRGRYTPNTSPFVMKLETYLRLAKIPYMFEDEEPLGPKGLSPWITLNGEEMADSQMVIESLGRKFNKEFVKRLTPEEQAIATAFDLMLTEHLTWGLRVWRYTIDRCNQLKKVSRNVSLLYHLIYFLFTYIITERTRAQGVGRHNFQEVVQLMRADLAAVSDYLGTKPFLMGDAPCEVDCTLFSYISQMLWNYDGSPYAKMVKEDYPNLKAHQRRLRELLYPDWQELCPEAFDV